MTRDPVARALGIVEDAPSGPRSRVLVLPAVPDQYDTDVTQRRYTHDDLPLLSGDELARARVLARIAWAQPGSGAWWSERVAAIEREIARRRSAG